MLVWLSRNMRSVAGGNCERVEGSIPRRATEATDLILESMMRADKGRREKREERREKREDIGIKAWSKTIEEVGE